MKMIKKLLKKSLIGTRLFNIVFALTLALATAGSWYSVFMVICLIIAIFDKGEEASTNDNNE